MNFQQNKNFYPVNLNKDNDVYSSYIKSTCTQQPESSQNISDNFLSSYQMPVAVPNNMPQQLVYNTQNQPMYNIMYAPQSVYRNQNTFPNNSATLNSLVQPNDSASWMSEPCITNPELFQKEKNIKYDTKLKANNVTSCCIGRVDNMTCSPLPNVYKTVNTNFYYNKNNIMESQWFYSSYDNQKYNEFPSCSQITIENNSNQYSDNKRGKSVKYCSIQKLPEPNSKLFAYDRQYNKSKEFPSCSQLPEMPLSCNLYANNSIYFENNKKAVASEINLPVYPNHQSYYGILQSEEQNGGGAESDIVVEDSDEEITDESEDIEKESCQSCLVCNKASREVHLYVISTQTPLTSYSQSPVYEKIYTLLGSLSNKNFSNHLCSSCLNLINNLDNLEIQLNTVKRDILSKYKTTLQNLKICVEKKFPLKKRKRKIKFRDVCGVHTFKCTVCEKIFSLKKFYHYHMSKHKLKTKTRYLCEYCGCDFVKRSNLITHLRKHKKNFVCYICGKTFHTSTNLKDHENFCSGKLPFNCNVCKERFRSTTKLRKHTRLKHEKSFAAICNICNKGFVKKSDLTSHLLSHSSDRTYICATCNKKYKTLSNLNHHLKIHEAKLPFICSLCQKGFLRKENLEAHENVHKGIKPYECSTCGKKFAAQKNLDAHRQLHSGVGDKPCPICGKRLRRLTDHLRAHGAERDLQCSHCPMKFITKAALGKHNKRKHTQTI